MRRHGKTLDAKDIRSELSPDDVLQHLAVQREIGDQLACAPGEAGTRDLADLQAEWAKQAADLVLVVAQLVDEELAATKQRLQFLALNRLQSTDLNQPDLTS